LGQITPQLHYSGDFSIDWYAARDHYIKYCSGLT
jgi:hypothetical protein